MKPLCALLESGDQGAKHNLLDGEFDDDACDGQGSGRRAWQMR